MKLMILDGNSIINRAFYGVHLLSTRDGMYTNAIFGFLNILHKLQEEERPDALCVAFDLKAPTFRHLQYEQYKANRKGMPEELAVQLPVMKEVLSAMNIPMYTAEGWEADDIIGTVSKICCQQGWQCVIATGDRDSLQLVNDCVTVRLAVSRSGQTVYASYTPEVFVREYGFEPRILVDLKALMGDSSDNIPGVAGVGPKTATELLLSFGTLKQLYENLEDPSIRPAVRKKLQENREMAELSYELATIRCDAPIDFSPEDCLLRPVDRDALRALFLRLEFLKLMGRYGLDDSHPAALQQDAMQPLQERPVIGQPCALLWDEETNQFVLSTDEGSCLLHMEHDAEYLREILASSCEKACCNLKQLHKKFRDAGLTDENISFDVSVAAYLLNPSEGDYSLDRLAISYLSQELGREDLCGCGAALYRLWRVLEKKLQEQGIQEYYREIEIPLCRVLGDMETAGVCIHREALQQFDAMLGDRIRRCQEQIFQWADGKFNINSPKQLGEVLFERMGLPAGKKTKNGYSTGAEVLEKIRSLHPIVPAVLEYRMLTKLQSTYAEGLLKVIGPDGRVHTTFQNTVTATGRLSSTDPNLQNIPVRSEMGSEIRKMFVPAPGWVLVDADYSQIELRVLAHIAQDEAMQQAFLSGADFHTAMASRVFGVPLYEVTADMRRKAKAVNFGVVYGISEFSLAEDLGISRAEAREFIDAYLRQFSGIAAYRRRIVEEAKANGFVTTLIGRRRYIPELQHSNHMLRMAGERIALNTPIQGTAADIMKIATVRVAKALREQGLQGRLLLQVHDELIAECPPQEAEQVAGILRREMSAAASLTVPLTVEANYAESWYAAK